jgi:hypothetical protein
VDDEVNAPIKRILTVGRGEGVVNHGERASLAAKRGERRQVQALAEHDAAQAE